MFWAKIVILIMTCKLVYLETFGDRLFSLQIQEVLTQDLELFVTSSKNNEKDLN